MSLNKTFQNIHIYLQVTGILGISKLVYSKITKLPNGILIKRNGHHSKVLLRIPSSDIATYKQVFIDDEYNFFTEKNPKVIIDAGANIGLTSIYFANKYPNAKIIAIEPEISNFSILEKNIAPYPNIVAVNAALWNQNKEIQIFDSGYGKWGFTAEEVSLTNTCYTSSKLVHKVPAITIDRIMQDYNIDSVDILKMDIEGSEKEVFSDSSLWINDVKSIIIELHEFMKSGCTKSFYTATEGKFDLEWRNRENIFLSKKDFVLYGNQK